MYRHTEAAGGSESIVLQYFGQEPRSSGVSDSDPPGLDELPFYAILEACCGTGLKKPVRDTIEVDTSPLSDVSVCEPVNAACVFRQELAKARAGGSTMSLDGFNYDMERAKHEGGYHQAHGAPYSTQHPGEFRSHLQEGGYHQFEGGYHQAHGAPHPGQHPGEFCSHPQEGGHHQYQGGYHLAHGTPHPGQDPGKFVPHPQEGGFHQYKGGYRPAHGTPHPGQDPGKFRPHPQEGGYNQYQGAYHPVHGRPHPGQDPGKFSPHPQEGGYNQYQGGYEPNYHMLPHGGRNIHQHFQEGGYNNNQGGYNATHCAPHPDRSGEYRFDENLYDHKSSPKNNLNSPEYAYQGDTQRQMHRSGSIIGPQPECSMGTTQQPTFQYKTYANAACDACCQKRNQQKMQEKQGHHNDDTNRGGPRSDASSFFDPRDANTEVQLLPPLPLFPIRESAESCEQFEPDRATVPAYAYEPVTSSYPLINVNADPGGTSSGNLHVSDESYEPSMYRTSVVRGASEYALRSPKNADESSVFVLGSNRGYTSPLDAREERNQTF